MRWGCAATRVCELASRPGRGDHGDAVLTPAAAQAPLLGRVVSLQNEDGGFGARDGLPSATEPTALALLALASQPHDESGPQAGRAREWLVATQASDGGWPVVPSVSEPSWTTALAVLALARDGYARDRALAGARWLLGVEGRRLGRPQTFTDWLLGRESAVVVDDTLTGWPWVHDTFSWIEPTAYAVLALDALRAALPPEPLARRLDVARRMMADRACTEGGWNYGNSRVLGEELWPYPDTTALALLALRNAGAPEAQAKHLDVLERMLAENGSGLATALGVLALDAYGRDVGALRARLGERFVRTDFLGETRALAWASLALGGGARAVTAVADA
jgi:hypothetical protein